MNQHLPAGRIYQVTDIYQLAGFKSPTAFFNIKAKKLIYCGGVLKQLSELRTQKSELVYLILFCTVYIDITYK